MSENAPEIILRSDAEIRQVGNMMPEDIHSTEGRYRGGDDGRLVLSLASVWAMQGIQYELTDPVATEKHTSSELARMGLRGVTLIIPKKKPAVAE